MTDKGEKTGTLKRVRGQLFFAACLACAVLAAVLSAPGRTAATGLALPSSPQTRASEKETLTKEEVRSAETRLAELGYWISAVDGVKDESTRQALIAFQKVEGRKRTGILTRAELAALLVAEAPVARESHYAHVEVDLLRQVLFVVDEKGRVSHILPVSTGSGESYVSKGQMQRAVTPTGKFTVCRKITGWRRSDLGLLYYPNYICGGVAIHGSPSVPVTPRSHGCIRIPMFAAEAFSRMTPIGTIVVVHRDKADAWAP